jgi:hypothetical protein
MSTWRCLMRSDIRAAITELEGCDLTLCRAAETSYHGPARSAFHKASKNRNRPIPPQQLASPQNGTLAQARQGRYKSVPPRWRAKDARESQMVGTPSLVEHLLWGPRKGNSLRKAPRSIKGVAQGLHGSRIASNRRVGPLLPASQAEGRQRRSMILAWREAERT